MIAPAVLVGLGLLVGQRETVGALFVVALFAAPVPTLLAGMLGAVIRRLRALSAQRRATRAAAAEVAVLADLVVLGLTAGYGFAGALAGAAAELESTLRTEVELVVRSAQFHGTAAVLEEASGHAMPLYRVAGRAVRTGASMLESVSAFAVDRRAADHAAALERVRKLPVKLLFPLALLVLPGFLLLLVAPALAGTFDRLRF